MAQDYVSKVRALLDRAEHPGTSDEERAVCQSKVMTLMTRHSITDAMIGDRGETKDEIGQIEISFTGIFATTQRPVTWAIADAMGCKCVINDITWSKPKRFSTTVTGWKSDLERLAVLDASLQMQWKTALKEWEREQGPVWKQLPNFEKYKDRRQFLMSFTSALRTRLRKAFEQAVKDAAQERAEESHGSETETEALAGVALALRDRRESVRDWFDKKYGNSLATSRSRGKARGDYGAAAAGRDAGSRADIGQHRVGGGRRAIGR